MTGTQIVLVNWGSIYIFELNVVCIQNKLACEESRVNIAWIQTPSGIDHLLPFVGSWCFGSGINNISTQ